MEEALWSLEDKWKVSTHKAIALFVCTSFLLIGVCVAAAALRRRRRKSCGSHVHQEPCKDTVSVVEPPPEEKVRGSSDEASAILVVKRENGNGGMEVGWQSHNSCSPVWQRPILMGEKCELPRFSGLILYDLKGIPLHHHQEIMSTPVVRTTLRDLL